MYGFFEGGVEVRRLALLHRGFAVAGNMRYDNGYDLQNGRNEQWTMRRS